MSLTINNNSTGVSNLFASMGGSNSSSSNGIFGMSGLLSEYNSIKNGSYAKLAKQYYSKTGDTKSKANSIYNDKFADKTTDKQLSVKNDAKIKEDKALISDVSSLRSSISSITNDDTLLDKKTVTDDKGVTTMSYDYDKAYGKVKSFVDSYNKAVKAGGDSDDSTILRNTLSMTSATERHKKDLEKIGITIKDDNTLSIDESKFKKADMQNVADLFSNKASYGKQIDTMATNIASQAASDIYSMGGYNSDGAYKRQLESIYNTTV